MILTIRPTVLLLLLVLGFSLRTVQAAELEDHPGLLDIDSLSFIDGRQANVEVTLNGPVLKMLLQWPVKFEGDEEARELLKVVDQILVRVYTLNEDQSDDMLAFIAETSERLERESWQRIVRVRENEDESVDIHVRVSDDGENLSGLVIMAVDNSNRGDAEVVFVNVAGNFNPAYLANIGDQLDVDYLDGVEMP